MIFLRKYSIFLILLLIFIAFSTTAFGATTGVDDEFLSAANTDEVDSNHLNADLCLPFSAGWTSIGINNDFNLVGCFAYGVWQIGNVTTGLLLTIAGWIFNLSVAIAIKGVFLKSAVVQDAWTILRDLANILFIFIIIYIGISTILRISSADTRKLLARVIIIAILINFSLVFTGVIIDFSNVLALSFYNRFETDATGVVASTLSTAFIPDAKDVVSPFLSVANPTLSDTESFNSVKDSNPTQFFTILLVMGLMSIIVNLVIAFVFAAGAILFIIRIVVLWFIMVLAPLAFAAYILPATQRYAQQWWQQLINQSLFAVVFLALLYVVSELFKSGSIFNDALSRLSSGAGLSGALLSVMLGFMLVAGFLIATLIISKQLGAYGASAAIKTGNNWRKKGVGAAGRSTIGGLAYKAKESSGLAKLEARFPRASRIALKPLEAGASASFGGKKGGYEKVVKDEAKRMEKRHEELEKTGPEGTASLYASNLKSVTFGARGKAAQQFTKKLENKAKQRVKDEEEIKKLEKRLDDIKETERQTIENRYAVRGTSDTAQSTRALYDIEINQMKREKQRLEEEIKRTEEAQKKKAEDEKKESKMQDDIDSAKDQAQSASDSAKSSSGDS